MTEPKPLKGSDLTSLERQLLDFARSERANPATRRRIIASTLAAASVTTGAQVGAAAAAGTSVKVGVWGIVTSLGIGVAVGIVAVADSEVTQDERAYQAPAAVARIQPTVTAPVVTSRSEAPVEKAVERSSHSTASVERAPAFGPSRRSRPVKRAPAFGPSLRSRPVKRAPNHGTPLKSVGRSRASFSLPTASVVKPQSRGLQEEVALVDRARRAFENGNPDQVLRHVAAHRKKFRHSAVLAPEAALLEIEALVARGQLLDAAQRARVFVSKHADDPQSDRVRRLQDEIRAKSAGR